MRYKEVLVLLLVTGQSMRYGLGTPCHSFQQAAGPAYLPVTISLKVPATMKVRADVSAMTMNSTHTIRNAITPPSIIKSIVSAQCPRVCAQATATCVIPPLKPNKYLSGYFFACLPTYFNFVALASHMEAQLCCPTTIVTYDMQVISSTFLFIWHLVCH